MKRHYFSRSTERSTKQWKRTFSSRLELLEARQMLAGDAFQNPINAYDVNGDSFVSPIDALIVLETQRLNFTASEAAGEPGDSSSIFADVTGDGKVDDQDLTAVVSEINAGAGEPGDVVTFRFDTVDLAGNSITSIEPDTEFELVVFAEDTRPTPFGIFAGYLDIEYPASLATALEIIYNDNFQDGKVGAIDVDGLIDEAGAFTQSQPATPTEEELFRVRLRADNPGPLVFTSNEPDESPLHEILVFEPESEGPVSPSDTLFPTITLQVTGEQTGDIDLVAFAKALAAEGVELWTSSVNARGEAAAQLALFGEGQHFLTTNEVFDFVPSGSGDARFPLTTAATAASIASANIWIWPDDSRSDGSLLTLDEIATASGVAIPRTTVPSIVPIEDVTVLQGSPLHIPLDGYDPNGDPLTYTVTVGDNTLVDTFIPQGNRSISIPVSQEEDALGEMVLQLYEGRAPLATSRFIELAESGFHEDVIFHRIINDFMIQGGDPTGTGSGGSTLGDFDDQFNVDLQHNRRGILSMAKSGDDTNDSQFFITEVPTRHLDFNHTIFGQLVEGERVRQTISNVETGPGTATTPLVDVVMSAITVFEDTENAVVMLSGLESSGSTTVTVTATDPAGNSSSETFTVNLANDPVNNEPFLTEVGDLQFEAGANDQFRVEFIDVEGDSALFSAFLVGSEDDDGRDDDQVSVSDTGVLTASGWVGTRQVGIRVSSGPIVSSQSPFDQQIVSLTLFPTAPTGVDLVAAADSGISDTDNITNVTELQFDVSGVSEGDTVIVLSGETEVGRGQATGETITITQANTSALGSGEQMITAVVERNGLRSQASPTLAVTLDQNPPAAITNIAPATADVGVAYVFDAAHDEESAGDIRYSLDNAPTGMQIDAATGVVSWTPNGDQRGTQTFDIVVTDLAGNENVTNATVDVEGAGSATVSLELRDSTGNPTVAVANGASFFVDVYVEDIRGSATGVTQAFVDLAFDTQGVAQVDSSSSIQIGTAFPNSQQTGTVSASGVINVGGVTATPVTGRTLLATIPMIAQSIGALNIDVSANAAGIQLAGESQPLAEGDVQLTGASVAVLAEAFELTANDDTLTIDEDSGEHVIDVLANDAVTTTGGAVIITLVSGGADGAIVAISSDGRSISYTPAPDFPINSQDPQTDTFEYTITDSVNNTSTATVTVTVNPVNDPPVANDDEYPRDFDADDAEQWAAFLREDSTDEAELFVIHNDSVGPDAEFALFILSATSDTGATVEVIKNRTWVSYVPGPNVFGADTFTYTVEDQTDNSVTDTGTVTVNVAPVNDDPIAENDSVNVESGQPVILEASLFTANDSAGPLEDETQTLTIVDVTQPSKGTVSINADGSLTYTANSGAVGSDTFTYTVRDDGMTEDFDTGSASFVAREDFREATATVTVNLDEGNSAPTAVTDVFPVVNDGSDVVLPVLQNDQDDGDLQPLEVTEVGATTNGGTVTLTDGVVRYQPADDFVGTDSFTYTISDGEFTDTAEVTVDVLDEDSATNSRFSGAVFFDLDGNGTQDESETGIAGVPITLSGTDSNGNEVTRQAISNTNGLYQFNALPPGTFEIQQNQSKLLLDGEDTPSGFATSAGDDTFAITVADTVVISEGNTFAERGMAPKFAMLDAISSSRRRSGGFLTAVNSNGSEFVRDISGWDGYSDIRVSVSSDQSEVTIKAVDENAQNVTGTLDATDKSKVSMFGRDGDTWLLRITVAAAAANLQPDGAAAAAADAVFADN